MAECFNFKPIGVYKTRKSVKTYDLPRQPQQTHAKEHSPAVNLRNLSFIELEKNHLFEQAMEKLEGFSRIWVIFLFHENTHWNPKIRPPRGEKNKIGVFASRSPYRPNPIGISCLELVAIKGLRLYLNESDLLNNTPILDIKPYIPYCDSFPEAKVGWLENIETTKYTLTFSELVKEQISFLKLNYHIELEFFIYSQLSYEPLNKDKKRLWLNQEHPLLGYKTWLVEFSVQESSKDILISKIKTGYSHQELIDLSIDKYKDKNIHQEFVKKFYPGNL